MRISTLSMLAAVTLGACTQAQVAATTAKLTAACQVDQSVVPIADVALAAAGGATAAAAAIDAGSVHPAIVAACAAVNGIPVVVKTPTVTAAAPTS